MGKTFASVFWVFFSSIVSVLFIIHIRAIIDHYLGFIHIQVILGRLF